MLEKERGKKIGTLSQHWSSGYERNMLDDPQVHSFDYPVFLLSRWLVGRHRLHRLLPLLQTPQHPRHSGIEQSEFQVH